MRHPLYLIGLVLILGSSLLSAQGIDSTRIISGQARRIKILPVPTIGYEPETKTYVGAVALFTLDLYQDSLTRISNTSLELTYTFRNQLIAEADWNYFFREEKWNSTGILHFSKYPDYYYGIGNNSSDDSELLYDSDRFIIDLNLYRKFSKKYFAGGGLRYQSFQNITSDSVNIFPELKSSSVLGVKGAIFLDTRNNLLNSTAGAFYFLELDYNFSESDYKRLKLDLRKYLSIREKYTFAFRLYNSFTFNTPAFFDYPVMGGDEYVRGYFYGRYRDKNLSTFQTEFRMPLFWRFGLAAIGGISSMYPEAAAFGNKVWPNYGGGLRFLVDKKDNINLRIDYVLGADGHSGFYIAFGESF